MLLSSIKSIHGGYLNNYKGEVTTREHYVYLNTNSGKVFHTQEPIFDFLKKIFLTVHGDNINIFTCVYEDIDNLIDAILKNEDIFINLESIVYRLEND